MINGNFLLNLPQKTDFGFSIYPPTIKDLYNSNGKFSMFKALLTVNQQDFEDKAIQKVEEENGDLSLIDFSKIISPFDYLIETAFQNKEFKVAAEDAFYFFTKSKITFMFDLREIWFGDLEEIMLSTKKIEELQKIPKLTKENYFNFQNLIRSALGEKEVEPCNPKEHVKIKRIKMKGRQRDKIKAQGSKGLQLESSLVAICCMNMGLNPLNIGELSYASVNYLIDMYQSKEKYTIDIDSLLAGADSKKVKPKYWIHNI